MKKKLSIRQKIDKYFLTIESRGKADPVFFFYLLFEATRIGFLIFVIYMVVRWIL